MPTLLLYSAVKSWKPTRGKHVAAVVERHDAQPLLDHVERETQLGIDDQQLVAALRHRDLGAGRRDRWDCHTPESFPAARRRSAENRAACCRRRQRSAELSGTSLSANGCSSPTAQAVRPDDSLPDVLVVRRLGDELREAEVRSQPVRAHAQLIVQVNPAMRVQHIVARVVHPARRHRRQVNVQLVRGHQVAGSADC